MKTEKKWELGVRSMERGEPMSGWVNSETMAALKAMGLRVELLAETGGDEKLAALLREFREAQQRQRPQLKGPSPRVACQKAARRKNVYG